MAQNRMTQQALLDHLDGADTDVTPGRHRAWGATSR